MDTRSWYMLRSTADQLGEVVDDLHFQTRLPKHVIMAALVNVVSRHQAEVAAEAEALVPQDR
jgi:hypothetical protein